MRAMLTRIPATIAAGDTLSFTQSLTDYPAPAWTLTYTLIGSAAVYSFTSTPSGADHLCTVAASVTAAWTAGAYTWTCTAGNGTERYTIATGAISITPNPATATATDPRSHCKRVLDAIEAVIEGRATTGDQELTVDGTRLVKMTAEQLLTLRSKYLQWYRQEQNALTAAAGLGNGRTILARFV